MKPRHLAFMALIDIVWAFNIVAIKFALNEVPPLTAVFIRYAIVLMVCAPWVKWLPGRMRTILIAGVIGGALFFGLGSIAFSVADNVSALAVAGQLGVPFSLILAVVFLKERIRWPRMIGIGLAFAGVVVLGFDPAIVHERLGLILTVAASMAWAVSSLLFRQLQGVSPLTIHGWLAVVSLPLLGIASLIFEPGHLAHIGDLRLATVGWLAYSAIGASVIGHAGMSWLLQRYPISTLAPLTLPTPLLSVIIAVVVLGNPLTPQLIAGGLVTLAGIAIITVRTAQARDREDGRAA